MDMKAIKVLSSTACVGALLISGSGMSRGMNQDPMTPEGNLSPALSAHMSPDGKASLGWTDVDAQPTADPQWRAKVSTESLEWVRRVIRSELLPATPVFKLASIEVSKSDVGPTVEYDGTRMKCEIDSGTLYVTQTKGRLFVLYHPNADPPGGRPSTTEARKAYLEDHVKRLFNHAPAMLSLVREEYFFENFALGIDLGPMLKSSAQMAEAVHALDPELNPKGALFSYFWGNPFFCTDGRDVFASFHKMMGGMQALCIDSPRWERRSVDPPKPRPERLPQPQACLN
jgi:hypothetical protein